MFKFLHRLKQAWEITLRDTLSPIFEKSQFFTLLTIPTFLLLSFISNDVNEEIDNISKSWLAIIFTLPIWFLINLALSPFRTIHEERMIGEWVGNRFIFHTPLHIRTVQIVPSMNDKNLRIKIDKLPKNAFVQFKIESDGGHGIVQILMHEKNAFDWGTGQARYGLRIGNKREAVLHFKIPPESVETVSRISVLYFEE